MMNCDLCLSSTTVRTSRVPGNQFFGARADINLGEIIAITEVLY